VTNQNYTDTCSYDSSSGIVSCSHGSDLIQFTYGYAPGTVSSSASTGRNPAYADPSLAAGSCGSGISVNAHTSCPFAQHVVDEYEQQARQAGSPGSFAVYSYSPVTNHNYTDACSYDSSSGIVSCSHGSDLIQFAYGSR
jgi:hypothetical protein